MKAGTPAAVKQRALKRAKICIRLICERQLLGLWRIGQAPLRLVEAQFSLRKRTPDRPIIWYSWQDQAEYRVRAGDRYLGRGRWEYYLGFEERPSISKEIKISMIHFVKQAVPDVLLAPGRRYGIVEVTNSMSAYKVYWSWVARDVPPSAALPDAYPW